MNGYVVVDLTGLDISSGSKQTITGSASAIAAAVATGKPIILTGIDNDGDVLSPVSAIYADGVLYFLTYTATISAADDGITVADILDGYEKKTE
ncbi:MAG: hypothetical protein J6S67_11425 [Methanobrevibacter sp.]|nr:hypothetical protein [Methanobrevibacter sp.]